MIAVDPAEYAATHGLVDLVGHGPSASTAGNYAGVDPSITDPYAPDWPDLVRLHRIIRERRVTTVLEFGCGHSTLVMAHALAMNRAAHGAYVRENLRRSNAFEIHAVDDMPPFVEMTRERLDPWEPHASVMLSDVHMTTFADRICTEYARVPNVCPDLIYLDGPSQASACGMVNGISTNHPDRLPMACDILRIEHFLLPGTLIVIDGRTANARFLACNLQRGWVIVRSDDADVTVFELMERPLGKINERQVRYCLGDDREGLRQ